MIWGGSSVFQFVFPATGGGGGGGLIDDGGVFFFFFFFFPWDVVVVVFPSSVGRSVGREIWMDMDGCAYSGCFVKTYSFAPSVYMDGWMDGWLGRMVR